jgi:hypothetical protein
LTSIHGVLAYIQGTGHIAEVFEHLFVPASGSFFVNLLLQKALLKNSLDLYRFGDLIIYLWNTRFTSPLWKYLGIRRYMTPIQQLKAAETTSLYIEVSFIILI